MFEIMMVTFLYMSDVRKINMIQLKRSIVTKTKFTMFEQVSKEKISNNILLQTYRHNAFK